MRDPIARILKVCIVITFTALVLAVVYQVSSRILFPQLSQVWTEEITRFLFIYSVALGAPLALKNKAYVNIGLVNKLPRKMFIFIELLVQLLNIFLFAILFLYGIQFALMGVIQRAPTINIPMVIIFAAIPTMGALMVLYGIVNVVIFFNYIRQGGDVRIWQ